MPVKTIIDHQQVSRNRKRAETMAVDGADFLLRHAVDECIDRLSTVKRDFSHALIAGPRARFVGEALQAAGSIAQFQAIGSLGFGAEEVLAAKPEAFDLAISLFALHETNDTPGVMIQTARALKPDGLFMACVPGSATLGELRDSLMQGELATSGGAHMRVLPLMDVRDAGALLQRSGFALPVTDTNKLTVRYDTMFDLARDLRAMGASNTLVERRRQFTVRGVFTEAAQHYATHHADGDGRIRATFELVWMSGWKPDASQPKPLKPGSAKVSLANVLGDRSPKTA